MHQAVASHSQSDLQERALPRQFVTYVWPAKERLLFLLLS